MGQCCDCLKQHSSPKPENVITSQSGNMDTLCDVKTDRESETVSVSAIRLQSGEFRTLQDFKLMKTLGRGSFGKVLLVKLQKKLYAMKILPKEELEKKKQQSYAIAERNILVQINHPFLVRLRYAFQTEFKLYMIMDYCQGGELFFHLRKAYKFKEDVVIFYAAEIICALEYLHDLNIIYRDLKPENILLQADGHIKITDFGLSKVMERNRMAHSIVGTPEYLAPEVYQDGSHDETADWWSLGSLMYEMLTGASPFYSKDRTLMFRNRAEKPIDMKPWFSEALRDLLLGLLNNNPKQRFTRDQIKKHVFFGNVNWDDVVQKKLQPPIVPQLDNEYDLRYFNKMYVEEPAMDSPVYRKEGFEHYDKFSFQES